MKLILALLFASALSAQTCNVGKPGGTLCGAGSACTTPTNALGKCYNTAHPGGTPQCNCVANPVTVTTILPDLQNWLGVVNDPDGYTITEIPVVGGAPIVPSANDFVPQDDNLLNIDGTGALSITMPEVSAQQGYIAYIGREMGGLQGSPYSQPMLTSVQLPVGGTISATFSFTTSPDALMSYWSEPSNTCLAPPALRIYITGQKLDSFLDSTQRWYSVPSWPLGPTPTYVGQSVAPSPTSGTVTFSVPLDPGNGHWLTPDSGDDTANKAAFTSTLGAVTGLAVTLGGGCYYAHGLQLSQGSGVLSLKSISYHP